MIQVELQETMGSDASIANAAWTSTYDKTRREGKYDDPDKVAEIVRRCVREGHSVPLESVVFRFWCRWPVFVDRQHMTHRMASHNGLSGRYRTLPNDFYGVPLDVAEIVEAAGLNPLRVAGDFQDLCANAFSWYESKLYVLRRAEQAGQITNAQYKRAREMLRAVLPTAFMVERTTVINLVSFANYQRLRNSNHAQPETREGAIKMLHCVTEARVCPIALEELALKGWAIGEPNHDWEGRI